VEFGHRVTSGGSLLLALAVAAFGVLGYAKGHRIRRAAIASLVFTLTEALIGAGLVLFGLVAQDRSPARAFSVTLHLTNTFILFSALALTVLWTREKREPATPSDTLLGSGAPPPQGLTFFTLGAVLLLGLTGALTALGDTLFPSASLAQGMSSDFGAGAHFLLKLRVIHPVLALATAALLFRFSEETTPRLALGLRALTLGQLILGLANLLLLAPTALQLAHLVMAESLWITLIWAAAPALSFSSPVRAATPPVPA
jgi:heme A synthase